MVGEVHVDVGFLEKSESWKLFSHLFPSKVGGRPAWLSLKPIPSAEDLKCLVCSNPCVFLLQIYSPLEDKTESFHRTLFVFVCSNPSCCKSCDNGNFVVLRSDLSRKNEFYCYEPPNYDSYNPEEAHPSASDYQRLCLVCGCAGTKSCSRCSAPYCCRSHQVVDWRRHKNLCNTEKSQTAPKEIPELLFPEFGVVIEPDDTDDRGSDDEDDYEDDPEDVERRMKEFKEVAKDSKFSTQELEQLAFAESDETFDAFKKLVEKNPEQIIRYSRGGEPAWITKDQRLMKADVPPCEHCGAERIFEFQVMPQLVARLNLDSLKQSIDWGVLVVYTCGRSCTGSETNYRREFLYKQDIQPRTSEKSQQ